MKIIVTCSLALGLFCGTSALAGDSSCGDSSSKHCPASKAACCPEENCSPLAHQNARADMLRIGSSSDECSDANQKCDAKKQEACDMDAKACKEACEADQKECPLQKRSEARRSARQAVRKGSQMTVIYSSRGGASSSTAVEVRR